MGFIVMISKIKIYPVVVILFIMISCKMNTGIDMGEQIICDAEVLSKDSSLMLSVSGNYYFENANLRTDEESFSGSHSVKLTKSKPYGFSIKIQGVRPDDYYEVSAWKKGITRDGLLVCQAENANDFYVVEWKAVQKSESSWERVFMDVYVPPDYDDEYIKIYTWNKGEEPVFFDDIIITRKSKKIYPKYNKDVLKIFIDTAGIMKLKQKRLMAFSNGVLESSDFDWVDAIMFDKDSILKAETRLKGDWLDHLHGEKWSFRIKLKKDHTWRNLKTFSIHTPYSRDFLNEWFLHKLFEREDVLATRYGFVPVELNGKSLGIYAYEEHFEKHLVETQDRREGPILKLSEEFFWIIQRLFESGGINYFLPYFDASEILPFKLNRTLSDSVLKNQFIVAQNLVNQFKCRKIPVSDIFDIEPLAKYLALINLTSGYHGLAWHNFRFYYNPVLSKLELVAFDCFSHGDIIDLGDQSILGNKFFGSPASSAKNEELVLYHLFSDSILIERYIHYLEKYSDEKYLEEIFSELDEKIEINESILKKEFLFYSFNKDVFINNARLIREALPEYELKNKGARNIIPPIGEHLVIYDSLYKMEFVPAMVKAHKLGERNGLSDIQVINYFPGPISIIGAGKNSNKIDNKFFQAIKTGSYNTRKYSSEIFNTDAISNYIFFKVDGYNQAYYISISDWPYPGFFNPRQELLADVNFDLLPFCQINDNTVIFPEGKYTVESNIIIPTGYKVIFEPGCELDFINETCLVSLSPVTMQGLNNKKIRMFSSDMSATGFSILQAEGSSIINNTEFEGFNTLDYKGWTLTGAVNFYESDVEIINTLFHNNYCEDALNIIRSDFTINKCRFENIFSDAFDSDYSTGQVNNTYFEKINNDAMDFSASEVLISDCTINLAGDKGISSGENSIVDVFNTSISNSNIGIASKDLSLIRLDKINISYCNYGFVGFIKKPEFGPSRIITKSTECTNVQTLMYIEKGSLIDFNGEIIRGQELNIADKLYQEDN